MTTPLDEWLRRLCTAHGLTAGAHHGRIDYRADDKIVVNLEHDGSITLKLPLDEQHAMLDEYPDIVSLPAGWAKHGWTTIRVEALSRDIVTELVLTAIETVTGARPHGRGRRA